REFIAGGAGIVILIASGHAHVIRRLRAHFGAWAVGPFRQRRFVLERRRLSLGLERLIDFEQQFIRVLRVGQLLPIYDAKNEIDRVVVAREWQQYSAIGDHVCALIDELGLETDG